jgi:hypothetical protein
MKIGVVMKEKNQKITYFNEENLLANVTKEGPFRKISHNGRSGVNATSIHSRISIPKHSINERQGSLTFWVMPIESLHPTSVPFHIMPYEPSYNVYALLSDNKELKKIEEARFSLFYSSHKFREITAKFNRGGYHEDCLYPDLAIASSGENVSMEAKNWYQIGATWDRDTNSYFVYINGIRIGSASLFAKEMLDEDCGEVLFAGNPTFALSTLSFYDTTFDDAAMAQAFKDEATYINQDIQEALLETHVGASLKRFTWKPLDTKWELKMDVPLNRPEDFNLFHVQGCPTTPRITEKGLLFETNMVRTESAKFPKNTTPPAEVEDPDQVYFWTNQFFEGDLAVEYDFMPLQENGLSVLVFQASGMQHEDFMSDYPLRTSGCMRTIWGENVRNYDWEYWREMDDIRHDTESHIFNKQPWGFQLAHQSQPRQWTHNEWHHIQLVQEGQRLRGTIDGVLIFDVIDSPDMQQGPTFNCGHIAIRCMWKTKMLVKDFKVYNKPIFEKIEEL